MHVLTVVIVSSIISEVLAQEAALSQVGNENNTTKFGKADMLRHCQKYCNGTRLVEMFNSEATSPTCNDCFCDDFCNNYSDCCPDSEGNLPPTKPPMLTCIEIFHEDSITDYLMKKTCQYPQISLNTDVDVDKDILHPVVSRFTGMLYFNEWYALCNGDILFTPWTRRASCNDLRVMADEVSDNTTGTFSNTNEGLPNKSITCQDTFVPPPELRRYLRKCNSRKTYNDSTKVSRCNTTGLWFDNDVNIETLCSSTHFPIEAHGMWYQNIYCYVCNGYTPKIYPLQSMINVIQFNTMDMFQYRVPDLIMATIWFDPITNTSRWLHCPPGSFLEEDDCINSGYKITQIEYWFEISFTLPNNYTKQYKYASLENMVFDKLSKLFSSNQSRMFSLQMETYITETMREKLSVIVGFLPLVDTSRTLFEETMINSIYQDWYLNVNRTVFTLRPELYNITNNIYTINKFSYILDPITGMCCQLVREEEQMLRGGFVKVFRPKMVNLTNVPMCPYVILNDTEFTLNDDVASLSYADVDLTSVTYVIQQSELLICRDDLLSLYNVTTPLPDLNVKGVVSLVFTCLSMLCLLLTLITYCTFSQLRTLPTKNNMFLIISLLFAQGLFQFSTLFNFDSTVCSIVGLVVHFLWLTVFLWMNVCSFHMVYIFVISKTSRSRNSQVWLLRRYIIYVYTTATIIVVSNVVVNVTIRTHIGYGGKMCYLSSGILVAITFLAPLALILISNVVFFALTVYTISQVKEIKGENRKERQNIFIYLKLSTLTGILWIVVVLATFIDSSTLDYIAIGLGAGQGVLIFFSYMANKRILCLWRSLCGITVKETSSSEKSTKSTIVSKPD